MIEAREASKVYGRGTQTEVQALEGVSVRIERGSFTVLVGPSGSGKSTLLSLLGALDRASRGEVTFDGVPLSRCSDTELTRVRQRIGFVFQDAGLVPGLSARDNVAYPLIPRGVGRAARLAIATELLTRFGLGSRARASVNVLSVGEARRVALARALVTRPEVIVADEPTASLDPDAARGVLAALMDEHHRGATLIASSHDPAVIGLATQVVELFAGRVVVC